MTLYVAVAENGWSKVGLGIVKERLNAHRAKLKMGVELHRALDLGSSAWEGKVERWVKVLLWSRRVPGETEWFRAPPEALMAAVEMVGMQARLSRPPMVRRDGLIWGNGWNHVCPAAP